MAHDELEKLAAQFLKEAGEGPVHRRLRESLEAFAGRLGMERVLGQLDGNIPDVYRVTWTKPVIALVADAKDSENQRLSDSEEQIRTYCTSIATRVKGAVFKNAILVIATDSRDAATEWVNGLARLAKEAGLKLTQAPALNEQSKDTFFAIVVVGA